MSSLDDKTKNQEKWLPRLSRLPFLSNLIAPDIGNSRTPNLTPGYPSVGCGTGGASYGLRPSQSELTITAAMRLPDLSSVTIRMTRDWHHRSSLAR